MKLYIPDHYLRYFINYYFNLLTATGHLPYSAVTLINATRPLNIHDNLSLSKLKATMNQFLGFPAL